MTRARKASLLIVPTWILIKTDTGDPANPYERQMVINTYDKTFKIYADGAFRQLATW